MGRLVSAQPPWLTDTSTRAEPDDAGTEDRDASPPYPRHTAQEDPHTSQDHLQRLAARLNRQPPGHLGHRHQERQGAAGDLYGLVADGHDLTVEELLGQRPRCCQVQIRKDDLTRPHQRELRVERLLHFEDQLPLLQTSSALATIVAPAAWYAWSRIELPAPAPRE